MTDIIPIRWPHVNRRAIIAFPHSSPLPQPAAGFFLWKFGTTPDLDQAARTFFSRISPLSTVVHNSHGEIP
jgi:hypothetical protein